MLLACAANTRAYRNITTSKCEILQVNQRREQQSLRAQMIANKKKLLRNCSVWNCGKKNRNLIPQTNQTNNIIICCIVNKIKLVQWFQRKFITELSRFCIWRAKRSRVHRASLFQRNPKLLLCVCVCAWRLPLVNLIYIVVCGAGAAQRIIHTHARFWNLMSAFEVLLCAWIIFQFFSCTAPRRVAAG